MGLPGHLVFSGALLLLGFPFWVKGPWAIRYTPEWLRGNSLLDQGFVTAPSGKSSHSCAREP